jgi:predicted metal-dependent peptidase
MGRRGTRDHQLFNIANDYAVNADLKRHKVGEFIKTVPCLYEPKYDRLSSEEIYDDLIKNAKQISIDDLVDQMVDDHLDGEGDEYEDGDDDKKKGKGKRPSMSPEEREKLRQEIKQAIINAASSADAGSLPAGVERLIKNITDPVMPWRELLQTNLTSAIKTDFSWMRPSRRGWHMDAIMPGMTPGEEIDVVVAVDMSGSISSKQAQAFLGEVGGMMNSFDGYRVRVISFDTQVYNDQQFTSEDMDDISSYVPVGGGGTDFDCVFKYLKEFGPTTKRLIMFTDGFPCGSWGDPEFCDTTFIIHGSTDIIPPFGQYAYLKD